MQRRLRPQPLWRTPVPFVFPSEASPDGNTKVVFKIVAEGSPPVAARPTRWPPRARSWPSSNAGPGRVTPRTTRTLPGWEGARPRRRDGRSPSRRPGGPAPMRRQRRPRRRRSQRRLTRNRRPRPEVIAGRRENIRRLAAWTLGQAEARANSLTAAAALAATISRGVRGGTAPRQPPQGTHRVWPQGVCWLNHETGVREARGGRVRDPAATIAGAVVEHHRERFGEPVQTNLARRRWRSDRGQRCRAVQALPKPEQRLMTTSTEMPPTSRRKAEIDPVIPCEALLARYQPER